MIYLKYGCHSLWENLLLYSKSLKEGQERQKLSEEIIDLVVCIKFIYNNLIKIQILYYRFTYKNRPHMICILIRLKKNRAIKGQQIHIDNINDVYATHKFEIKKNLTKSEIMQTFQRINQLCGTHRNAHSKKAVLSR